MFNMKTNANFRMPKRGLFEDSQYPQKMNYGDNGQLICFDNIKTQAYVTTSIRFLVSLLHEKVN
jgi:hypothetical protein